MEYSLILRTYNPWWNEAKPEFFSPPSFHRLIFDKIFDELNSIPQILSITGPRRIGKSTILHQIIEKLVKEKNVNPKNIIYYSFDDPLLYTGKVEAENLIEYIYTKYKRGDKDGILYLFFDEIQKLERWELYLKKYYDLKYPVKVVISGSASSPIFKKTRESLLGRIKDYHLLPFSFREYILYHRERNDNELYVHFKTVEYQTKELFNNELIMDTIKEYYTFIDKIKHDPINAVLNKLLEDYIYDGGFPEVWSLPDDTSKREYLTSNQVDKVIFEDLTIAAEFRKPELLKRFYISLLESPGREVSMNKIASETGINLQQIEKYLPLLEMTDLVYRLEKYRASPLRIRQGNMKFYLVDLALRNAVLRVDKETMLKNDALMGRYAENLVFITLKKWMGMLHLDYYRDKSSEVDFIAHLGSDRFIQLEVKYREQIRESDLKGIRYIKKHFPGSYNPIVITKNYPEQYLEGDIIMFPLPLFLLFFDL